MVEMTIRSSQMQLAMLDFYQIRGLEYFSSAAAQNLESRFGHTNIRLIDYDDDPLNDLVISFEPLIPVIEQSSWYKYWNATQEVYPLYPVVRPMYMQLQIVSFQKRNFLRQAIRLTETEKSNILIALKDWVDFPDKSPYYSFQKYNCAYGLFHLFDLANIDVGERTRFPGKLPKLLVESSRSLMEAEPSLNIEGVFDKLMKLGLANAEKSLLLQKEALEAFSGGDVELLMSGVLPITPNMMDQLLSTDAYKTLKGSNQLTSIDEKLNLRSYPDCYYDFSVDEKKCLDKVSAN
ncbi:MAG: DUF4105 domain-containing protein [Bdellovibrionota bacterium]|nr:DUF4105 domain-containing protein [Bdellovibrionota bacterium]